MLLFVSACSNNQTRGTIKTQDSASVTIVSEKIISKVGVSNFKTSKCNLLVFMPGNLKIDFTTTRPAESFPVYFCIAGAFTSKDTEVDGLSIENGIKKTSSLNKALNGFVEIKSGKVSFYQFNDSLIETIAKKAMDSESSLFQQQLLIKDKNIILCNVFGNRENKRRALIEKDGFFSVVQSLEDITIWDFQKALKEIEVLNAIYLDMGSWSEGWYFDEDMEKQTLGDNFANTRNQTSWIIFKRE